MSKQIKIFGGKSCQNRSKFRGESHVKTDQNFGKKSFISKQIKIFWGGRKSCQDRSKVSLFPKLLFLPTFCERQRDRVVRHPDPPGLHHLAVPGRRDLLLLHAEGVLEEGRRRGGGGGGGGGSDEPAEAVGGAGDVADAAVLRRRRVQVGPAGVALLSRVTGWVEGGGKKSAFETLFFFFKF